MISSPGRPYLALGCVVIALFLAVAFGASAAEAQVCPAGSQASVTTIHTSCTEAKAVLGKALKKLPLPKFRVFVHGWWHCSYTEVGGLATFTAERKYGTPQRQVVIVVTE
jgi:hypothetical protein